MLSVGACFVIGAWLRCAFPRRAREREVAGVLTSDNGFVAQSDVLGACQVLVAADAGFDLVDNAACAQEGFGLFGDGL